jgi:hypothetical protein
MSQLFKTFGKEGHKASGHSQLKSSAQRAIRGGWPLDLAVGVLVWAQKGNAGSHGLSSPHPPIAAKISEQYPWLESSGVLEVLLPKKQELTLIKL